MKNQISEDDANALNQLGSSMTVATTDIAAIDKAISNLPDEMQAHLHELLIEKVVPQDQILSNNSA